MDNDYLRDLIHQVNSRHGGLILNVNDKAAAVVLSMDRYNELLLRVSTQSSQTNHPAYKVLITGGAGYIGSYVARQLLKEGHTVTILDDLSTGKHGNVPDDVVFTHGQVQNSLLLTELLQTQEIDTVIHLAGTHSEEGDVDDFIRNNTGTTASLLKTMRDCGVSKIIFASSASVYGHQQTVPIPETASLRPTDAFAYSKLLAERLIQYYCNFNGFKAMVLRLFNVYGTDPEIDISDPHPGHLFNKIRNVLGGQSSHLVIDGNRHDTFDGTSIRDYIHVTDVARIFAAAVDKLPGLGIFNTYNVGSGVGCSVDQVLEGVVESMEKMVPLKVEEDRNGTSAVALVADIEKLKTELQYIPVNREVSDMFDFVKKQ